MTQPEERMVARLAPSEGLSDEPVEVTTGSAPFLIQISATDGTVLLRMYERAGRLVVEGDESRWEEGAKLFVAQMMQWSGLVGIRWKGEALKAADG